MLLSSTKSDQVTGLSWPVSSFRGSEILASIFDVPWKKAREGEDGAWGWSQATLLAQTHCRHCHRLGKTNTNRSCLKEEGQDTASDSNTAPTSASPLRQSSAPEKTATRSFRDKQELNPLISQSCTAERAAKLFSSCTLSSSPSKTLLLASLQPLSHGPGREKGRQNLFGVHLLPELSQRGGGWAGTGAGQGHGDTQDWWQAEGMSPVQRPACEWRTRMEKGLWRPAQLLKNTLLLAPAQRGQEEQPCQHPVSKQNSGRRSPAGANTLQEALNQTPGVWSVAQHKHLLSSSRKRRYPKYGSGRD